MNEQILMDLVERTRNRFYGKYRGTVTKVDTANGARIKATVPAVLGTQETGWCMACVPYAGNDAGIAFLPEVDSGVWIEFEGGDVSYPIWTGCYWHQGELPSEVKADVKVIKTKGVEKIILSDKDHKIDITDSYENHITVDRNGITIYRGKGKLLIEDGKITANNGAMEVTAT
jgi:uncharacterized protein involved in type VI secretion and phage assembly